MSMEPPGGGSGIGVGGGFWICLGLEGVVLGGGGVFGFEGRWERGERLEWGTQHKGKRKGGRGGR